MSKTNPSTVAAKPIILFAYKACFVPKCMSTTSRTPLKLFIRVPKNKNERQKWRRAAGSTEHLRITSWICEDHFDLSEDMKNYQYWKLMGGPYTMRKGILPRFFDCQNEKMDLLPSHCPRKSESSVSKIIICDNIDDNNEEFILPDDGGTMEHDTSATNPEAHSVSPRIKTRDTQTKEIITNASEIKRKPQSQRLATNTTLTARTTGTSSSSCDKEFPETMKTMPMEIGKNYSDSEIISNPCNGEILRSSGEKMLDERIKIAEKEVKMVLLRRTIYEKTTKLLIEDNPLTFIGMRKDDLSIINDISQQTGLSKKNIHLVLKKLRLNLPNQVLAAYFGVAENTISSIIKSDLPKISKYMRQWIRWPGVDEMRLNMPAQCGGQFGRIQSIIDVFDICIDKPTIPVTKTNEGDHIRRYLISITPDGMINYFSSGYNGTITNSKVIENSEYLNVLPNRVAVLSDSSYETIEIIMKTKKCVLLRPPIIFHDAKSTERKKSIVQVTSVREYVEKIIQRLRDFRFFDIQSFPRDYSLENIDQAFIVAAALVNFQTMDVL